jgi:hypothetical protein
MREKAYVEFELRVETIDGCEIEEFLDENEDYDEGIVD